MSRLRSMAPAQDPYSDDRTPTVINKLRDICSTLCTVTNTIFVSVILCIGLWIVLSLFPMIKHRHGFDYSDGPNGLPNWGGVCRTGRMQSPIDLPAPAGTGEPSSSCNSTDFNLGTHYRTAWGTVSHNYEHWQLEVEGEDLGFGELGLNRTDPLPWEFTLKKFHFHSPSEHKIDGIHLPLEMHLVHSTPRGMYAVVAVLFQAGDEPNPFLSQFWGELDNLRSDPKVEISFDNLPLRNSSYFLYTGSLTTPTPDCVEGVTWIVIANERISLSQKQLDKYSSHFPDPNSRPVQPLNGRPVELFNVCPEIYDHDQAYSCRTVQV